MRDLLESDGRRRLHGNFHVLLGLLLLAILLQGFAEPYPVVRHINLGVFLLAIIATVQVASRSKFSRISGYGLLLVWLGVQAPLVLTRLLHGDRAVPVWLDHTAHIMSVIVFGWMLVQLVFVLLTLKRVSAQALSASLCAYLLIGIWFFAAYELLPLTHFEPQLSAEALNDHALERKSREDLFYYSFVTLTSLGYGDVTPVSPLARSLSILEVVLGQFYLAVLIARQVGLFLVGRGMPDEPDETQ